MQLKLALNGRSALIIVDMQEYFFRQLERRSELERVTANINLLIEHFEYKQLPIFHIVSRYKRDGSDWDLKMMATGESVLIEGTPEAQILPEIKVTPAHSIIAKTRYSAFFKTNLAELLRVKNIQRAVVTGAYTHYCVNATVFDAYGHDFVPCIITDAVTSHLQEESRVMIERMIRNGYHVFTTAEYLVEDKTNLSRV
jgi:nicotinamidase-related amidase